MSLSAFIRDNLDSLAADCEAFAAQLPAGRTMSAVALRDHSREIMEAIADHMERRPTGEDRAGLSQEVRHSHDKTSSAAAEHGALRQLAGFDLVQPFAEFRAMRANVIAAWQRACGGDTGPSSNEELIRFNEGMDKAMAESVQRYSSEVAASRDMFLAVLGHDLRGPLSSISMSATLLARAGLDEDARQAAAARVTRASHDMDRLITDLLEYTRTRLGAGIPVERIDCDLGPVCEAALEEIRASHPEQAFVQQLSGDLALQADAARLQQVLSNLLNNAVQHGSRGGPVTMTVDGKDDAIVLTVGNTGEPIPSDVLPAIFEPLVHTPGASASAHERSRTSLGLGLFIVREIVLAHGGTIGVESSGATGTVFTIRLPRARADA